jgi:ATP-dependent DNA helicase RecG
MIEAWGRGTLKMAELSARAGLVSPEFEEVGGDVVVRFRPSRYVPPARVSHELSPLQRELLGALADHGSLSLSQIMNLLSDNPPERTVQNNLRMLRELQLVEFSGRGPGARWSMRSSLV